MIVFLIVFILAFSLTWLVRRIAIRKSIMDIPNERSSHSIATPRGGGIALAIAWFTGLTVFYFDRHISSNLYFALLSGLPLALIGFIDDIYNLKPALRFIIQFICAGSALFFLNGLSVSFFDTSYFDLQNVPFKIFISVILNLIAFTAIIWSVNLFNFLDGIDGYISTEVIFIGAAIYFLTGDKLTLLLCSATMGFLFWNWQKAKIFMGDVGSTLLGFIVAVLAIYHQNNHVSSFPVWLILTSVFWFDATVTLFRRIKNKESLSQAHRKHAYQRIVQSGFSHQKTVLWVLFINSIGLVFAWSANTFPNYSWIFLVIDITFLVIILKIVDARKNFEYKKSPETSMRAPNLP